MTRSTHTTRLWRRVAALAIGLMLTVPGPALASTTTVSISGTDFLINGSPANPGTAVEGLLLNSRMVQAAFDDANPGTRTRWAYPDSGTWDAERNNSEFLAAIPTYAEHGLSAVTVSMQGGNPVPETGSSVSHDWIVSAFAPDGSLDPAWIERLRRVIAVADEQGMVVILTIFYQGQDEILRNEAAVLKAVDNTTDWLLDLPHRNVLVEIANEIDHDGFDHDILSPSRVAVLIDRVQKRSQGALSVSTSFKGRSTPVGSVIREADYIVIHSNNESASELRNKVATIRQRAAYLANPKPIVVNEDGTDLAKFDAAVSVDASWGYYDKGLNNYQDGFQALPVNWSINTESKREFFANVRVLTDRTPAVPADDAIVVSESADRAGPVPLAGATLDAPVYIFIDPQSDVSRVVWYLDDPQMIGQPYQTEFNEPYDFAGGGVATARAFDVTNLTAGAHVVTALLVRTVGPTTAINAAFSTTRTSSLSADDAGGGSLPDAELPGTYSPR